jgi:hypothetical protein
MPAAIPAPKLELSPAIDRDHLRAMTMGDRTLELDVLRLFDKQAALLLARMYGADPASLSAMAHAVKGSARGIGAWAVAAAAEGVERDGADGGVALDRLAQTIVAVRAEIAVLA